MKSVKQGRGPSFLGGIVAIFIGINGIVITALMLKNGAGMMAFPGFMFVAIAVVMAIYNFKNATSKNRYSVLDITEGDEEPDPLNQIFGEQKENNFCPYCGEKLGEDFKYCNNCGKQQP